MKLFIHDFLIALGLTLLLGGIVLVVTLSLLAKPPVLEGKKSDRWSVEELQR